MRREVYFLSYRTEVSTDLIQSRSLHDTCRSSLCPEPAERVPAASPEGGEGRGGEGKGSDGR